MTTHALSGTEFHRFVPIMKVDEERREVHGILAIEQPDHSGEVMDYARSKPNFEAWSQSFADITGGKSHGNLRAMHRDIAAGKFTSVTCDDELKGFPVIAKVVDDNEWKKCLEGVYTGFSIGGKYGDVWTDGDLLRYEALPIEGSLVDKPCIPGATFTLVRSGGATELRKFANAAGQIERWVMSKLEDALQSADDAVTAIREMAAQMVSYNGPLDTWAIEDLMQAIRRVLGARFSAELQADDGDGGLAMNSQSDMTKQDPTVPTDGTAPDPATDPAPDPATDTTPDDNTTEPATPEPEPATGTDDAAKSATGELTKALTDVMTAIKKVGSDNEALTTLVGGLEKTIPDAVEHATIELRKAIAAVDDRLKAIEAKPRDPGRPVDKTIGAVGPVELSPELAKADELITAYESGTNVDPHVARELRLLAARLAMPSRS